MSALSLLLKTSKDEDSNNSNGKKRLLEGTAAGAARSMATHVPLGNSIIGGVYGAHEGHPIVGIIGGPAAVEGAKSKDRNGKDEFASLAGTVVGGTAAGAAIGYGLHKPLKNAAIKKSNSSTEFTKKLFEGDPSMIRALDRQNKEKIKMIKAFKRADATKLLALGGGVASAGGYLLGRVAGHKKDPDR